MADPTLEGPEEIDEVTEYILSQEQMDAIERMLLHYAEMMTRFCVAALHMEPGPDKSDMVEEITRIEDALLEVASTLFPERHANAVAAKEAVLKQMTSGWN